MMARFQITLAMMLLISALKPCSAQTSAAGVVVTPAAASDPALSVPGSGTRTITGESGTPITLDEAIRRAQTVDHNYVSAVADRGTADAARTVTQPQRPYDTVNTQTGNGGPVPIFIANNSVREYVSEGVVTETIGVGLVAGVRRSYAESAAAKARLEVARRGLVAAVVGAYYGSWQTRKRHGLPRGLWMRRIGF
jgi:hypothetical protein